MAGLELHSTAFRQAALRSERLRVIGLISVILVLTAFFLVRNQFTGESKAPAETVGLMLAIVGFVIIYEAIMLAFISRGIRTGREPPFWVWVCNVLVETMLPTVLVVVLTVSPHIGPFRALVFPAFLLYFFFIILSTLRLSPALCALTGIFSASGYAGVTAYTFWRYGELATAEFAFPLQIYVTYSVWILLAGFVAGGVAHRVRIHVRDALREAETRRQMERMEHDLGIARSIQQGLLPESPPDIPGYDIAGWSEPADETGGDYYDWQPLPDGRIAFTLADVTGHGIGPALVTAVCRAYSRASFPSGESLTPLMQRINNLLVEDLPSDRFVTFVVGLLDPQTAQMHFLSAGHGPILIYRAASDVVEEFDAQGIPFGVARDFDFDAPQDVSMAPGDMLILLTDGFFEWANPEGELYGLERLNSAIRALSPKPAADIIAGLHEGVVAFARGTSQDDDLTCVIVKRE